MNSCHFSDRYVALFLTIAIALIVPLSALADFAPQSLPAGAQFYCVGTETEDGDTYNISYRVPNFWTTPFSYSKTGPNTATIDFEYTDYLGSYVYCYRISMLPTFSRQEGGTYTLTGNYDAYFNLDGECGVGFLTSGTFTGFGTFIYEPPKISISLVQTPTTVGDVHSFVSTDYITLQATFSPGYYALANVPVKWTVRGVGPAVSGISGFPLDEIHNANNVGVSTFTFRPSDNTTFVNDRQTTWTKGNKNANPAIGFEVIATAQVSGQTLESRLSQTTLGPLLQDETDTLRQEYVDFQIPDVPHRLNVVSAVGDLKKFNGGNYSVMVSFDLPGHYDAIQSAYRGRVVTANGGPATVTGGCLRQQLSCSAWPWQQGTIPQDAGILYRRA